MIKIIQILASLGKVSLYSSNNHVNLYNLFKVFKDIYETDLHCLILVLIEEQITINFTRTKL